MPRPGRKPEIWTEKHRRGDSGTIWAVNYSLTPPEQEDCLKVAKMVTKRYEEGKVASMKFKPSTSIADVNQHGFGAEYAVARVVQGFDTVNRPFEWNRGVRKLPDIGNRMEVRWTRRSTGFLPVYEYDKMSRIFVLVTGEWPDFRILGWAWGFEVYQIENFVPKGRLLPDIDMAARFDSFLLSQEELHPWPAPPCTV